MITGKLGLPTRKSGTKKTRMKLVNRSINGKRTILSTCVSGMSKIKINMQQMLNGGMKGIRITSNVIMNINWPSSMESLSGQIGVVYAIAKERLKDITIITQNPWMLFGSAKNATTISTLNTG